MRKQYVLLCLMSLSASSAWAQLSFTNASARKSAVTASGGCMGVVDMNGDGLDDLAILHNSRVLHVDYQNPDGSFTMHDYGSMSNAAQWGWAIADIDNDGHKDVVSGGNYDGTHYMRISGIGTGVLNQLTGPSIYQQAMSIGDINNDRALDVFACNDVGPNNVWLADVNGDLNLNTTHFNWATNPSSDMSGNYGSCFTDFDSDGDLDLYIAKCRQGVNNSSDPRRWNRLFVNDGSNAFADQAAAYGLEIRNQTWTADFGDYDNDGDLDMVATNHDATIQLFENVDNTTFVDVTAGCGMEYTGFFLQSKFVDFDNDGFLDVLIAGGVEYFFKGNGDGTFTPISGLFPAGRAMHSFATGDLNNDGFTDVFANYGTGYVTTDANQPDRLWLNDGNDNHWLTVRLQGTISNRDAVGAQVRITGPWGTQVREVKAGESYGMVTTFACSFGLGEHSTIPTLTVRWPSGLEETFEDLNVDQAITIVENTCISPVASISPVGAPVLCTGGAPVVLSVNEAGSFLWNTGATTQEITVEQPGVYSVVIDDGSGCTGSASINVPLDPDETPTVSVIGDVHGCEGNPVELTSSEADGYTWSDGLGATRTIEVTTSGTYTVSVPGACGTFISAPVVLDLFAAPDAPLADDVMTGVNSSAELYAEGDGIQWYDVAVGGTAIATGNTFVTPELSSDATYWASASMTHGGDVAYGGRPNKSNSGVYQTNTDYYQVFTAYEDMVIRSVKVYANSTGERTIAVIDRNTGATIAMGTFEIPTGEQRVELNFSVPAGGPYGLRCVGGSPGLWRDGLGSNPAYPYALGTLGSMTSSSVIGANATAYYYFFYDLEVASPSITCEGSRTEVNVNIGPTTIADGVGTQGHRLWPNPSHGTVNIAMGEDEVALELDVFDVSGRQVYTTSLKSDHGLAVVDLSHLAAGDYTLALQHTGGRRVTRLVLQ